MGGSNVDDAGGCSVKGTSAVQLAACSCRVIQKHKDGMQRMRLVIHIRVGGAGGRSSSRCR